MASFGAGSSKGAYVDSPFGPSHTVSKFHMLLLCYYNFKPEIILICSSPRNNKPQMAMVQMLMLATVRILMLVMTMSTPLCRCTVYMGDISGDSVQIFTEAPPGVSKFGRPY